ncbi:hypothetical protein EJ05DRAFT_480400 [Pseudovirgaria hyperparasitica]|uniref:F-box domain-containing protein n=1 Tax=Pseudovirgaria hyperparasitica TaxID=470096 RepID=A0A6A6VUC4_9PEZI|nr:uncharacterized protein EJ05DRAFT_480400 [Pseudovirgaria hyperparasitica]KAF2753386.1 hypothetical protein EJ05DRAFT_480400 [Pseudovirgaria hyperparasitica]
MVVLLDLSAELLQYILLEVNPLDLASLSRTCYALNHYINPNKLLWKGVFLRAYDCPTNLPEGTQPDWGALLRSYVSMEKILDSDDISMKRANFKSVAETSLNRVLSSHRKSAMSRNLASMDRLFSIQENVDIFISASSLFKDGGSASQWPRNSEEERQLSAKLHVLFGVPEVPRSRALQQAELHAHAKARVYDLRQYTDKTAWGPFVNDGSMRVDWEKAEAIMLDLAHNLEKFTSHACNHFASNFIWPSRFQGCSANSYESKPLHEYPEPRAVIGHFLPSTPPDIAPLYHEPALPLDIIDPYGVTGTWRRVVCFLDYTDLYRINFEMEQPAADAPRPPLDEQEAIRLIRINLRVTRVEPPGEHDGKDYPVVHFNGRSRSMHTHWDPNATSRIRGSVRQTPEGEIRWTSFSLFHGEERWRSEGIQVGGIRSSRGILGTWFDKDYEEAGPAGPTAFWKTSDDIIEEKRQPQAAAGSWHHAHHTAHYSSDDDDDDDDDNSD